LDRSLGELEATELIFSHALSRDRVGRIGVELEWLVQAVDAPARRLTVAQLSPLIGAGEELLPAGSTVSLEPGGQVELSTRPASSVVACIEAAARDLAVVRTRAAGSGLRLLGLGLDDRPPALVVRMPRYSALKRYYGAFGSSADTLLCNTASIQVNIEAGDESEGWRGRFRRWFLANALGPTLMAMFANSPAAFPGTADPARSGRQTVRLRTDPLRTGPLPQGDDPRSVWTRYAMDTRVIAVRCLATGAWQPPPAGLTLRRWLRGEGPRGVHATDVFEHLKSLVAPVRACGHLELRMIDAQQGDDWVVPVAVVAGLLDEELASEAAFQLVRASPQSMTRRYWLHAARVGLADPALAMRAQAVVGIARAGLLRLGVPAWLVAAVDHFAERYTLRGRCPADLLLRPPAVVA
jgi:glutamate--cysteine ligase